MILLLDFSCIGAGRKKEEKEIGQYISFPTHLSSLKVYSKINLLIFYYSILACKKKVDSRIEGLSFA